MSPRTHTRNIISLATLVFLSGCAKPGPNLPANTFTKTVYAAVGAGLSRLEPDTDNVQGSGVNNRVNNATQVTIGADLTKHLSLEFYAADLGSAGISPDTQISYDMTGVSGLVYAGKHRSRYRRQGLTGYGRLGFGIMDNSGSGSVAFRNRNENSLVLGAGVEYGTRIGLALRGEVISFDEDALSGQLGLVYRLGRTPQRQVPVLAEAGPPAAVPVPAVKVQPEPNRDEDADGVLIPIDQCLSTPPRAAVDQVGCSILAGVAVGVNFESGSNRLTQSAMDELDQVVIKMRQYPQLEVEVSAHTDSQGSAASNQLLSKKRANAVISYLINNGISAEKLKAKAFGESQPIASNDTVEGRLKNRRVELFARKVLIKR